MKNVTGLRVTPLTAMYRTEPTAEMNEMEAMLQQARLDLDTARAESSRIKKEWEEMKKLVPSEEERAKIAELQAAHAKAEEERLKKEGDFNAWRLQIQNKHEQELDALRQQLANSEALRATTDREVDDILISREFSDASELFAPGTGKTVLIPEVAQAFFRNNVEVQTEDVNGRKIRRVVVKDMNGVIIVDPKTGRPMNFLPGITHLIDGHPRKDTFIRGSGKSGSGSSGGFQGADGRVDLNKLTKQDIQNPAVRAQINRQMEEAGGLTFGRGFDRLEAQKNKK